MKSTFDTACIIQTIINLLPQNQGIIALHEPGFRGNERLYIEECLQSTWVSSSGPCVNRFEQQLAEYTGIKYAAAVVNGTAALHLALHVTGITRGDEVLLPALTFIATANAVSYLGAVPHFADSEERTLGLDPAKLDRYLARIAAPGPGGCWNKKSGRPIKAVVAMHTFGHPVDMDPLLDVCRRYKLILIEDAAQSLGSFYKNRHTGSWGRAAVLSFNGNKIISTGGGGAILTQDEILFQRARHLSTQARIPHKWSFVHDAVAYNYRMPNINAALGCAQMEQLPGFIKSKRNLAHRYQEAFAEVDGAIVFKESQNACSNYWLNTLLLNEEHSHQRDIIMEGLHQQGILVRPTWTLLHKLPMYRECPHMDLSGAESLERRIINLPSSAYLGGA